MNLDWLDIKTVIIVGLVLFGFGIWYNSQVAEWQKKEGGAYTAIYVAAGVFITLAAGAFVVGPDRFFVMLGLFGCSGGPMIYGSIQRHREEISRRENEARKSAQREIRDASK